MSKYENHEKLQNEYIAEALIHANNIVKSKDWQGQFLTPSFYEYANEFIKGLTKDEEIEAIDFTEKFWKEMMIIPRIGELINININAPPTSGKSVVGMAIGQVILKNIFHMNFNINNIDRDQQEYSMTMRKPEIKNTVRVIDEWNDLENTGENVTIERATNNYMSDVMAQRFIHKISCSPKDSPDKNALIYLEVISTNKYKKLTHCKLYYKVFSNGIEVLQHLGYINIYVGDVLKSKWYKEYRERKFEKMDLLLKEGIFRPRLLDYSAIILKTVTKLKDLTRLKGLVNKDIIRNYIKIISRESKIAQSIVGEELATREANGVLDLYKSYHNINRELKREQNNLKKFKEKGIASKIIEYTEIYIPNIIKMRKDILDTIQLQNDELERYKQIHEKYNKVKDE